MVRGEKLNQNDMREYEEKQNCVIDYEDRWRNLTGMNKVKIRSDRLKYRR